MKKSVLLFTMLLLLVALENSGVAQTTHYLYYAGGSLANPGDAIPEDGTLTGDNAVYSVLVADVTLSSGTVEVGGWRAAGQLPTAHPTLTTALSWMYMGNNVHVYNGRLYVGSGDWNGDSSTETSDFVAWADINSDGSLGTFTLSSEFPSPPVDQAICATTLVDFGGENAYYYVMGGSSSRIDRVLKSKIQTDGSLGTWSTDTVIPNGQWFNVATVSGTTILHVNGHNITSRRVHAATPSSSDGSIASWVDMGTYDPTATGRWDQAITTVEIGVDNKYVFIIAGSDNGTMTNDVRTAPLTGDLPGAWSVGNTIPAAFRAGSAVTAGDFILALGGSTSGGGLGSIGDVYLGQVDSSGVVTWSTSATPMLRAQSFGGAAIVALSDLAVSNWTDY